MSAYSTIDRETLKWVRTEVEATVQQSRDALKEFANSDDKSGLSQVITHLHQIDGSLQMLELKSLSTLINESERLAEGFTDPDSSISKSSFMTLVETAFTSLEESLRCIQQGVAENPIQIVELINQIRAVRGLDAVEISSLFSPMIDVYPPAMERQPISDDLYRQRAAVLRSRFQAYLLKWLRDDDASALNSIGVIAEKLLNMSTFGVVSRLWWVVTSYVDYAKNNELHSRGVHGRIFREIDDLLRNLVRQGESALVRDPGEELIKTMLFYAGVGAVRTERMDELVLAFQLQNYFPALQELAATPDYAHIQTQLEFIHESEDLPLQLIRQLVSAFFEEQDANTESIKEIVEQMQKLEEAFDTTDIDVISPVVREATEFFKGLRNGSIENADDCGFHLAAAIMFVENSLSGLDRVDQHWVSNGELKLRALRSLNNQEKITNESNGSNLSGSERQALLDVVGSEIEENLKDIEASLEAFFADPKTPELIKGIDGKIRQVRGALQVLGEQKVGLLLQMAEDQFGALQSGEREPTNALLEALAISIGAMEEYVQGLQVGRSGMDYLLDRSITDLEVAIGKKVSRDDVETLLDESSDALFSWTNEQSNFSLFNGLKSNLRDLLILSKKTGLIEVEELVKEQDRLVDVISQEPAFFTGNIINTLQSNMANIAGQIIQLYGTEETAEETELDADLAYKKSAIRSDDDGPQYHDDMDVSELGQELNEPLKNGRGETLSSTEVGKKHAAENIQNTAVDDVIFDVFVEESGEILEEARKQYAICKSNMGDREAIRELRRAFHTLKGSARMVGLNNVGEIAWLSESLFNYVLDTGKPLTESFMAFADDSLREFSKQLDDNYQNQHLVDVTLWGERTENVILQEDQGIDPHVVHDSPALDLASTSDEVLELNSGLSSELSIDSELLDGSQSMNFFGLSEDCDLLIESEPPVNPYMDVHSEMSVDADLLSDPNDQLIDQVSLSEDSYDEFDLDSVSFSVIEDPAMRQVFVDEVKANLSTVSEQLLIDPLMIVEDDALSIAVHTLHGNARTLGLDEVAEAYAKAESLCQLKLESGLELFPNERVSLRSLLTITHDCVADAADIVPYFPIDSSQWAKVSEHLQGAIDADAERLEKAANANLENNFLGEGESDDDLVLEFDKTLFDNSFLSSKLDFDGENATADEVVLEELDVNLIELDDQGVEVESDDDLVLEFDKTLFDNSFLSSKLDFVGENAIADEVVLEELDVNLIDLDDQGVEAEAESDDDLALEFDNTLFDNSFLSSKLDFDGENAAADGVVLEGLDVNLIELDDQGVEAEAESDDDLALEFDNTLFDNSFLSSKLDFDGENAAADEVVLEGLDVNLIELDDQGVEADAKKHDQSEVVEGVDDASERVAAVLGGLDSIDDLLVEQEGETREASRLNLNAGDLDNFELSLDSMRGEREGIETNSGLDIDDVDQQSPDEDALEEALPSEKDPAEKFKKVIQKINLDLDSPAAKLDSEANPDTEVEDDKASVDSLIPDELTNLLEDDMLAMEAAISTAGSEDAKQALATMEEELAAQAADITAGASWLLDLDDDLGDELREVFVEELKSLHSELDDEVAKLVDLAETAKAMPNVVRYLHTIKGSSLMVQANTLSSLTHQVESHLEGNFIRNADDLKEVRNTLEMYVDAVGAASDCLQQGKGFVPSESLLVRIGAECGFSTPIEDIPMPQEDVGGENIKPLDAPVLEERLANLSVSVQAINDQWKSARGWSKIQAQMQTEYKSLYELISEHDDLAILRPLVSDAQGYIENLSLHKTTDFKASKALLEEVFDVAVSNARALDVGQETADSSVLQSRLSAQQRTKIAAQPADGSNAAIFVPGLTELSSDAKQDLARQQESAQTRAAALRIKTKTLDSLTNFVGDASMNRSQMREDVLSIKGVVDDLYDNVRRFSTQLRELEIEADSKITARSNDDIAVDRGAEFDPLEMDRYSKLQQLSRGLAENLGELGDIQSSLSGFVYKAENSLQKQNRLNRELQDEIMQVRLVSFGGIGPQLRQVVRATARELNKDVELELIGAEVRLDKTILDGVIPALEHMLRNCVDHGIENRSQRIKANKSKTGKISVECRQVAREIIINVRDDGRGLDLDKIRAKAIADNLLAPNQILKPEDILIYISQSGFSTASELTQISGRGVGMDVVQATLRRMSGSVAYDVDSQGIGSSFTIRLPISLAVSNVLFVTSGSEQFAISARTIDRVVNIGSNQLISHLKADKPVLEVGGQSFALIDLADYLGYESKLSIVEGKLPVILVSSGVQNIAVIVEKSLDTHEIVIKGLGSHLGRIPIYSGATIRADGKVVLLVDLVGISYYESYITMPKISGAVTHSIPNVMVVDDSLTVRKSAERDITALGINAVLAKDGLDAQIQLRQEIPDMILLDIEMPRMDGFGLLEWIKSEKLLKDIPVIMISSRATEKHINKATQLGCSAFLGKPYLLENLVAVFNKHLTLEAPLVLKNE